MAKKKEVVTLFTWWDVYGDDVLNIASRAAKTFIQTAAAAGLLGSLLGGNIAGVKAAALAGLSAAISLVWNAALAYANR